MTSSGNSDELVPPLRSRRHGTKPGFLCVVPFLLEEKNITRINKDMCSKKEIERLKSEGFGPPPNDSLTSDGKMEFSLTLSVDEFKDKLVEIYPKLANRPFFLLKANKSNDLEHLDIEPSSYTPKDIYHSNLGQGRLYIRIGHIEDFEETIPRPKKKPRRDHTINPGYFPVYRLIQPKPITVSMSTSLSNIVQTSSISPSTRTTGIFATTPVASPVPTLSVGTSSPMMTSNAISVPRSTMLNQSASQIGVSAEAVGAALPSVDVTNVSTPDLILGQQQQHQQQQIQQQQQLQHQLQHQLQQLAQQLQQQQLAQQLQQQLAQQQVPSLQNGPNLERYLDTPTVNMTIPAASLSSNNHFVSPGNNSVLTWPFNSTQNSMSGSSREMPFTPSELPTSQVNRMTNSNALLYTLPDNNGQNRNNLLHLNLLADATMQNGPMQSVDKRNVELHGIECSDNQISQPSTTSAPSIPEAFDMDSFVERCRETGHLTVSKMVAQNQEILRRVHQENLTIHSLTIEPPCQPKEVYEMFQPPPTLESLLIKGNIFDDENTESLLVNFVFKLNSLVKLDLSNSTFLSDMRFTFLSSLGRLKNLQSLCLTSNKLATVPPEALAVALNSLSNLNVLNLSKNYLTDEWVEKISEKIAKLLSLEVLELSSNSITTAGASFLLNQISVLVRLNKLDLSCNFINDDFLENVDTQHLKFLVNLQELLLNSNKITWIGVSRLCFILHSCKSLQCLHLSSNYVGSSVFSLAGTGKSFRLLTSLSLANADINGEAIYGLRALLENVKKLELLDLSNNKLTSNDFELLQEPIVNIISLKVLNVSDNVTNNSIWKILDGIFSKITNLEVLNCENVARVGDGFSSFCPKFSFLLRLKKLNLGSNSINSVSMGALSLELKSLTFLEDIDLKKNYIDDEGFEKLCKSLTPKCLTHMKKMNFASNKIGNAGAKVLAGMLPSLHCLEELDLFKNNINRDGIRDLFSSLVHLKHLKKLNLGKSYNCYDDEDSDDEDSNDKDSDCAEGANTLITTFPLPHHLEEIRLHSCDFGYDDIKLLCSGLRSLTCLKILDICNNCIDHKSTKALADVLPSLYCLEKLCLRECRICEDDIEILCSGLKSLKNLKIFDTSGNVFVPKATKALAKVLPSLHCLEELCLRQCRIAEDDIEILLSALKSLKYLKIFDISDSYIHDKGIKALADVLSSSHFLEKLCLRECRICEDDIEILCSGLKSLKYLKIFDISENDIGPKGTKHLAKVLPSLHYLEELYLLHIGDNDFEILFFSLKFLMYLKIFDISGNAINHTGTKALSEVLPSLHFLKKLDLMHCRIGDNDWEILCSGLKSLMFLKIFNICVNDIGHTGTKVLSEVLSSLHFLEELDLGHCNIDDDDIEILCSGLKSVKYLKIFGIGGNNLADRGAETLANVLPLFYYLEELNLYGCFDEDDIEIIEILCSALSSLKNLRKINNVTVHHLFIADQLMIKDKLVEATSGSWWP